MAVTTKKDRLLIALRNGKAMSAAQIRTQFGFASKNSVYGTIASLREEGFRIIGSENRKGNLQYSLAG